MALAGVDLEIRYGSGAREWVKTPNGWVIAQEDNTEENTPNNDTNLKLVKSSRLAGPMKNNNDAKVYRPILVRGTGAQRNVSICLSDMLKFLHMHQAALELRRSAYTYEVLYVLFKDCLKKVSGTTHRQLFQILESITVKALQTELNIDKLKQLLVVALKSLFDLGTNRVGCSSLWNKHVQTVSNLSTRLEQFQPTQREDDGKLKLTDLPKECIREIMLRLNDHRDILHLGQCNLDLYYMSLDISIWERLAQYHFSEKQMLNFISDDDLGEGTVWHSVYQKCHRKYGLKKTFADMVVLCSKCKVLHWMMNGHACLVSEEEPGDLEPISPEDLIRMLNL